MNKKKFVLMFASVALIASTVLFGTLAYFTDKESIANTFTVGNIDITLDEAAVNEYGEPTGSDRTSDGNEYKLVPGRTYVKDPTITVVKGSEPAYVRMLVTISHADVFDAIFDAVEQYQQRPVLTDIFNGHDNTVWEYKSEYKTTSPSTITYEFRYRDANAATVNTVDARTETADIKLPALFESFTVPGYFGNQQIQDLDGMTITVIGQAIQSDSFEAETDDGGTVTKSAEDVAWDAFDTQVAVDNAYNGTTQP